MANIQQPIPFIKGMLDAFGLSDLTLVTEINLYCKVNDIPVLEIKRFVEEEEGDKFVKYLKTERFKLQSYAKDSEETLP